MSPSNLAKSVALKRYHQLNPKTQGFSIDPNQFIDICTKEVAYFLGFFWADGSIYRKGNISRITIEIVAEDGEYLKSMLMALGEWCVYQRQRKRDGKLFGRPQMSFVCNNRPLVERLVALGYDAKSSGSPERVLAAIPDHLKHYWWRGYFDGDGCLYIPKRNTSSWATQVAFWSTIDQDWGCLLSLLSSLGVKPNTITYERPKPNGSVHRSSTVNVTRKWDVLKLLRYLYQGEDVGLSRKRDLYRQIEDYFAKEQIKRGKSGSRFRGVAKPLDKKGNPTTHRWAAKIKVNKRPIHLGMFDTEEEAALAYNAKATEVWGSNAILNDIELMRSY